MSGNSNSSPDDELAAGLATGNNVRLNPLAGLHTLIADLFTTSEATRFGLSIELFTGMLVEVAAKYLPPDAGAEAVRELLATIHVKDLVLARACVAGNEAAWEVFLSRYRESLYDAGMAIAKDHSLGRELADSLYADLWGAGSAHGASPLRSYMGYGSLEGWLRTIMARSFIDRYRSQRRLVSLEEESQQGRELVSPPPAPGAAVDPRLEEATDEALGMLDAEDRFLLASFFLHDRTLGELARILRLHESTVSRRIHKITAGLRKQIVRGMMRRGMSRRQADEALESDVRDLQINVRARLQENLQETQIRPSSQQRPGAQKPQDDE